MHDFRVKEAKDMQAGALQDRVRELKETENGVEYMCREMEELRREGIEEGRMEEKKETAKNLENIGMPTEQIAQVLKVSVKLVQEWLVGSVSTAK